MDMGFLGNYSWHSSHSWKSIDDKRDPYFLGFGVGVSTLLNQNILMSVHTVPVGKYWIYNHTDQLVFFETLSLTFSYLI